MSKVSRSHLTLDSGSHEWRIIIKNVLKYGADVTRGRGDSGAEVTVETMCLGTEVSRAEVTRGRSI